MKTLELDKFQVGEIIKLLDAYRYILDVRLKLKKNPILELVFTYLCDNYLKMKD